MELVISLKKNKRLIIQSKKINILIKKKIEDDNRVVWKLKLTLYQNRKHFQIFLIS